MSLTRYPVPQSPGHRLQPSRLVLPSASPGVTYNDAMTGTLIFSGAMTESKVGSDSITGTLIFSGARSESAVFNQLATGTLIFAGVSSESRVGADAQTGTLVLSGSIVEGKVAADSGVGVLLLSGTGSAPPPSGPAFFQPDFLTRAQSRPGKQPAHVPAQEPT